MKFYLEDRYFQIRHGSAYSSIAGIRAGVPQGGILSPIMFNIYTSDQPTMPNTLVADYADDKAIISTSADPILASTYLKNHISQMEDCQYSCSETEKSVVFQDSRRYLNFEEEVSLFWICDLVRGKIMKFGVPAE
ncbi:hypothetical protein QTP88_014883 [Uroleucon formosanum]